MAKKMLTVKVEDNLIDPFKKLAEMEERSQGAQISYWIRTACRANGIEIPEPQEKKKK